MIGKVQLRSTLPFEHICATSSSIAKHILLRTRDEDDGSHDDAEVECNGVSVTGNGKEKKKATTEEDRTSGGGGGGGAAAAGGGAGGGCINASTIIRNCNSKYNL